VSPSSQPVEPFDLVIFGGTGDLAVRKLLPALFHRFVDGQIPPAAGSSASLAKHWTMTVIAHCYAQP